MEQTYTVTTPDQEPTQADLEPMLIRAQDITVTTQEEHEQALTLMAGLKKMDKQVIALFAESKSAANKAHKAVCSAEKELRSPIKVALGKIDVPVALYEKEQRRIAAERQRELEAQARAEEEERRLAEAQAAEEAGEHEQAEDILSEPAPPVVVKPDPTKTVAGVTQVKRFSAEVTSMKALTRYAIEFDQLNLLKPDQPALNKMAVALKGEMRIPGVKVVTSYGRSFRG